MLNRKALSQTAVARGVQRSKGDRPDMLSDAGRSAIGAVATGLIVSNPQQLSRVAQLLDDMVQQVIGCGGCGGRG